MYLDRKPVAVGTYQAESIQAEQPTPVRIKNDLFELVMTNVDAQWSWHDGVSLSSRSSVDI